MSLTTLHTYIPISPCLLCRIFKIYGAGGAMLALCSCVQSMHNLCCTTPQVFFSVLVSQTTSLQWTSYATVLIFLPLFLRISSHTSHTNSSNSNWTDLDEVRPDRCWTTVSFPEMTAIQKLRTSWKCGATKGAKKKLLCSVLPWCMVTFFGWCVSVYGIGYTAGIYLMP